MNSLSNDGNSNWLGFSLSPQMNNMEGSHGHDLQQQHNTQPCSSVSSASVPLSFSQAAPSHINYSNTTGSCYYGGESENAAFLSSLSVMPLKSDGSLCIMEAFNNRSHPQGFFFLGLKVQHLFTNVFFWLFGYGIFL